MGSSNGCGSRHRSSVDHVQARWCPWSRCKFHHIFFLGVTFRFSMTRYPRSVKVLIFKVLISHFTRNKYLFPLAEHGPVFFSYPLSVVFMWCSLFPSGVAMRLSVGPEWYQFFSLMHMAGLCVFLYPVCYDLSLFSGLPLNFVLIDWWPYLLVYWNCVSISSPMVCCLHKTVFYSFPVWILHEK